jgi:hypothetical protein
MPASSTVCVCTRAATARKDSKTLVHPMQVRERVVPPLTYCVLFAQRGRGPTTPTCGHPARAPVGPTPFGWNGADSVCLPVACALGFSLPSLHPRSLVSSDLQSCALSASVRVLLFFCSETLEEPPVRGRQGEWGGVLDGTEVHGGRAVDARRAGPEGGGRCSTGKKDVCGAAVHAYLFFFGDHAVHARHVISHLSPFIGNNIRHKKIDGRTSVATSRLLRSMVGVRVYT